MVCLVVRGSAKKYYAIGVYGVARDFQLANAFEKKAEEIHDVGHLGFDENEAGYGSSDKMIDN